MITTCMDMYAVNTHTSHKNLTGWTFPTLFTMLYSGRDGLLAVRIPLNFLFEKRFLVWFFDLVAEGSWLENAVHT